ncbi:MAG TPA: gliding motility-associated ABC transporter ATP-binding subunit GldA [Cytophagaceae bacterium]
MSVVVSNLIKTYGTQNAVNNISFQAKKGEITGFLGPNGAGKSTTMKIATCYIPPTSGTVTVAGYDVVEAPMQVKRNVGYLPEHNPLYLDMYVHEFLQFAGGLHGLKGNTLRDRVREMVEICGLTIEQNKKIGALSKGYRQRVGLAQALLHDPEVLILDEPTTGLDPNQILEIRNLIKSIGKEKTVIFSTHIMQEVQALCDRVVIINRGNIVADSPISELKSLQDNSTILIAEFDRDIDVSSITNITGVLNVASIEKGKYEIRCAAGKDVRGEIFRLAAEQGLNLIGLRQEERSLEAIFRDLTSSAIVNQ